METRNITEPEVNSESTTLNTISDSEVEENNSLTKIDSSPTSANISNSERNSSVSKSDQINDKSPLETGDDLDDEICQNVDHNSARDSKNPEINEKENKINHGTINDDEKKGNSSGDECESNPFVSHEKESVRSSDDSSTEEIPMDPSLRTEKIVSQHLCKIPTASNGNDLIGKNSHSSLSLSPQQNKDELSTNEESTTDNESYLDAGNANQLDDIKLAGESHPNLPSKENDREVKSDDNTDSNEYTSQNDFGIGKASNRDWMTPVTCFDEFTQLSDNNSEDISTLYEDSFSTANPNKSKLDNNICNHDKSGDHSSAGNIHILASCHGSDGNDVERASDESEQGIECTTKDLNQTSQEADHVKMKSDIHPPVNEPITMNNMNMVSVISNGNTDEIDDLEVSTIIDDFDIDGKSHSGVPQNGHESDSINFQKSETAPEGVEPSCQIPEFKTNSEEPEIDPEIKESNMKSNNESQSVESDKDDISKKLNKSDSDSSSFATPENSDLKSDKNHLKNGSCVEQGDIADSTQPNVDIQQIDSVSINSERSHSVQSIFAMSDKSESSGNERDITADSRTDSTPEKHGQTITVTSDSSSVSMNSDYNQSSSDQSSFAMSEISELIADRQDGTISSKTEKAEKSTCAQEKIAPGENDSDTFSVECDESHSDQSSSPTSETSGLIPKKGEKNANLKGDNLKAPPHDQSSTVPSEHDSISTDSNDSYSSAKKMEQSDEESKSSRSSKRLVQEKWITTTVVLSKNLIYRFKKETVIVN